MKRLLLPALLAAAATLPAPAVDFSKDIAPLFEAHCTKCHGPEKQKSNLRLDQRAVMLRGGDSGFPTLTPGKPAKSFLIDVINGTDPDIQMPPKGEPLTPEQVNLLKQWIAEGANWPGQMDAQAAALEGADHWAFQPVTRPTVPSGSDHPVDAFLNVALQKAGVAANAPADARTQIRRATMILTGLPPEPERVAAFEQAFREDPATAYATLVDELLASPHFGERWAQHWLDVIRWAETNGSESNLYRKNAWVYRDYVVRAFNEDLPYDRFIREQLAGDRLGVGEATGFLVAGPHVPAATVGQEPTAIRQARADRMDEVIQTVSASMLGLTMSCARCHNHKFDPISITDYYAMTGIFQDVEFGSRFPEFGVDHPRKIRAKELWGKLAQQRSILRKDATAWEENWGGYREIHWPPVEAHAVRLSFKVPNVGYDEIELFGRPQENINVAHKRHGTVAESPVEMVNDDNRNPVNRVNDGLYGTNAWRAHAIDGGKQKPWVILRFTEPKVVGRMRLSSNREYFFETDYLTRIPETPFRGMTIEVQDASGGWRTIVDNNNALKHVRASAPLKAALEEVERLAQRLNEEGPRPSFVGTFQQPVKTYVLHRGSPENARDEVAPGSIALLDGDLGLAGNEPGPERRVAFGDWLTRPGNPLTSRVLANRIWHHVFGSGLVTTPSDFGRAGTVPTHPELLDWLASELVREGDGKDAWSMKQLVRLLVTSDAFRRANSPNPAALAKDAGSALLWRFPPRRAEAEVIRDGILQASGKLDRRLGGRSYRIHNVKKTYAQWEVVDNHGDATWRRMLYQERMRRVDDRIFTAFDFPDCGQVRAKRPVSTTPLQALNLMNSNFVVAQSKHLAERARSETATDEAAIRRVFALLFSRAPDAAELAACVDTLAASDLQTVCRSLINANEFAFIP